MSIPVAIGLVVIAAIVIVVGVGLVARGWLDYDWRALLVGAVLFALGVFLCGAAGYGLGAGA